MVGGIARGGFAMATDPTEYGAYCDWRPDGSRLGYTTHDLNVFPDMSEDSNLSSRTAGALGRWRP
jgi:hypothetical protein